jgi:hypothetical protein
VFKQNSAAHVSLSSYSLVKEQIPAKAVSGCYPHPRPKSQTGHTAFSRNAPKCAFSEVTRANDLVASGAPPSLLAYIVPSASKCQHGILDLCELFLTARKTLCRAALKPQFLATSALQSYAFGTRIATNRQWPGITMLSLGSASYGFGRKPFQGFFPLHWTPAVGRYYKGRPI